MSAAMPEGLERSDVFPFVQVPAFGEVDSCAACGHSQDAHETVLTPETSFVICHEPTRHGECYRVRHSEGIPFGACQRDRT